MDGADEGIRQDLAVAEAAAQGTGAVLQLHGLRIAALRGSAAERRRGDVVVAEQAADLLGDVRHADQIGTPRRHADLMALDGDLQTAQIFDHVGLGRCPCRAGH